MKADLSTRHAVLAAFSDRFVERVVVGAILVRDGLAGPEVLLLRRRGDQEFGSIEELPSGGVEHSESLEEAALREVAEETSIHLRSLDDAAFNFFYKSSKGYTVQMNFGGWVPFDVQIRLDSAEHTDWRWVPAHRLHDSDLTPNVRKGVQEYLRRRQVNARFAAIA